MQNILHQAQTNEDVELLFGSKILRKTFLWMCIGLLMTAFVSVACNVIGLTQMMMSETMFWLLPVLCVAELVIVIVGTRMLRKASFAAAVSIFAVYSILNGVTLSWIFQAYQLGSIGAVFFITAAMFGTVAVIGFVTKKDLSKFSTFVMMGLIGLIVAGVVNLFFQNTWFDLVISVAGVIIFLGITIFDVNRIKRMCQSEGNLSEDSINRYAMIGALNLYLDFINLFLRMLRIMGRRR